MSVELGSMQCFEDCEDQAQMLMQALAEETMSDSHKRYVVWSAVMAAKDDQLLELVKAEIGELTDPEKRDVRFALSRMSVTNPYFFSRNFVQVNAGGSLDVLNMRPFPSIDVHDETGYHYACIAISMVNGGYNCFRSHVASLQQAQESDQAIDQAMRITAGLLAMRQAFFTQQQWGA